MKSDRLQRYPCKSNPTACDDRHKPVMNRRAIITVSAATLLANGSGFAASAGESTIKPEPIDQPRTASDFAFIERAFEMRQLAVDIGDQAYGAVVVRNNVIVGQSWSRVVFDEDPTAHAEIAAIRDAARRTGHRNLDGAIMYSSSQPCPMCEAAAYWAGIDELIHGRAINKAGPPALCR